MAVDPVHMKKTRKGKCPQNIHNACAEVTNDVDYKFVLSYMFSLSMPSVRKIEQIPAEQRTDLFVGKTVWFEFTNALGKNKLDGLCIAFSDFAQALLLLVENFDVSKDYAPPMFDLTKCWKTPIVDYLSETKFNGLPLSASVNFGGVIMVPSTVYPQPATDGNPEEGTSGNPHIPAEGTIPPKRKRGRPPGSKNKPKAVLPTGQLTDNVPVPGDNEIQVIEMVSGPTMGDILGDSSTVRRPLPDEKVVHREPLVRISQGNDGARTQLLVLRQTLERSETGRIIRRPIPEEGYEEIRERLTRETNQNFLELNQWRCRAEKLAGDSAVVTEMADATPDIIEASELAAMMTFETTKYVAHLDDKKGKEKADLCIETLVRRITPQSKNLDPEHGEMYSEILSGPKTMQQRKHLFEKIQAERSVFTKAFKDAEIPEVESTVTKPQTSSIKKRMVLNPNKDIHRDEVEDLTEELPDLEKEDEIHCFVVRKKDERVDAFLKRKATVQAELEDRMMLAAKRDGPFREETKKRYPKTPPPPSKPSKKRKTNTDIKLDKVVVIDSSDIEMDDDDEENNLMSVKVEQSEDEETDEESESEEDSEEDCSSDGDDSDDTSSGSGSSGSNEGSSDSSEDEINGSSDNDENDRSRSTQDRGGRKFKSEANNSVSDRKSFNSSLAKGIVFPKGVNRAEEQRLFLALLVFYAYEDKIDIDGQDAQYDPSRSKNFCGHKILTYVMDMINFKHHKESLISQRLEGELSIPQVDGPRDCNLTNTSTESEFLRDIKTSCADISGEDRLNFILPNIPPEHLPIETREYLLHEYISRVSSLCSYILKGEGLDNSHDTRSRHELLFDDVLDADALDILSQEYLLDKLSLYREGFLKVVADRNVLSNQSMEVDLSKNKPQTVVINNLNLINIQVSDKQCINYETLSNLVYNSLKCPETTAVMQKIREGIVDNLALIVPHENENVLNFTSDGVGIFCKTKLPLVESQRARVDSSDLETNEINMRPIMECQADILDKSVITPVKIKSLDESMVHLPILATPCNKSTPKRVRDGNHAKSPQFKAESGIDLGAFEDQSVILLSSEDEDPAKNAPNKRRRVDNILGGNDNQILVCPITGMLEEVKQEIQPGIRGENDEAEGEEKNFFSRRTTKRKRKKDGRPKDRRNKERALEHRSKKQRRKKRDDGESKKKKRDPKRRRKKSQARTQGPTATVNISITSSVAGEERLVFDKPQWKIRDAIETSSTIGALGGKLLRIFFKKKERVRDVNIQGIAERKPLAKGGVKNPKVKYIIATIRSNFVNTMGSASEFKQQIYTLLNKSLRSERNRHRNRQKKKLMSENGLSFAEASRMLSSEKRGRLPPIKHVEGKKDKRSKKKKRRTNH